MSDEILVAKQTFFVGNERISAGKTRVREGHPITKGREHMFEPLEIQYDVERATKAPGEKRIRKPKTEKPEDE